VPRRSGEKAAEVLSLPQEIASSADTSSGPSARIERLNFRGAASRKRECSAQSDRPEVAVKRILLVEDSATMRTLLSAALEELKDEVKLVEASIGFEALRVLPRESFDLIVTDINMPDINGLELVSFVKRNPQYNAIPLIIVSTEGSERDRERGLELGADAYVVKPFDPEDLCSIAASLLERGAASGRGQ